MKRFLMFTFYGYDSEGGFDDYFGEADNLEDAIKAMNALPPQKTRQIVDTETRHMYTKRIVERESGFTFMDGWEPIEEHRE